VHPIRQLLNLAHDLVAIAFRESPPPALPRVARAGPSGCSYWTLAAEGRSFYTEAADHKGCLVGAHTHNVPLTPAEGKELEGLVGVMAGVGYLDPAEVPAIPRREASFGVALYGPLGAAPFEPDVVLVRCDARRAMLLAEAARAAGVGTAEPAAMLRPTCALLPETIRTGRPGLSLGCVGNRVYTGLEDGELYVAIPGAKVAAVAAALAKVIEANQALEKFHAGRREKIGAAVAG
jgi:uncharacterized protein (DUF169 family)